MSTESQSENGQRLDPSEHYRLYIDESGDHVFKHLEKPSHRYLCLLGCFFQAKEYRDFHNKLESFKQRHIPHSPDEPVILHRADIINRRRSFWRLRDAAAARSFDNDLLEVIDRADFRIIAVVIDKKALRKQYPSPAHPYHLAMGFMLQRYCGLLNHVSRRGDVMAESRGGREDRELKASYEWVYERGAWVQPASFFQQALTSKKLKVKQKLANIAGLQLADILGHPVRKAILIEKGEIAGPLPKFATELLHILDRKFNKHLYEDRIEGYGKVFFPKK